METIQKNVCIFVWIYVLLQLYCNSYMKSNMHEISIENCVCVHI